MNDVATNGELDIDYIAGKLATTRIRHSDEMAMDGPAYCRWPNCSRGESFWTQKMGSRRRMAPLLQPNGLAPRQTARSRPAA